MDSPGFSAQYCTYTTMDNDSKEIISIVNIDKRETQKNSVIMEKEAFIRTFETLHKEIRLQEFCTDAHSQISALFSKRKDIYVYNFTDEVLLYVFHDWSLSKCFSLRLTYICLHLSMQIQQKAGSRTSGMGQRTWVKKSMQ